MAFSLYFRNALFRVILLVVKKKGGSKKLRKISLLALLYVFAFTSLFPNYNMENLFSPPQNDVYELSSASIDESTIIGEYPTKSKKLKKSVKAVYTDNQIPFEESHDDYVFPSYSQVNNKIVRLTPYQFQSNYL